MGTLLPHLWPFTSQILLVVEEWSFSSGGSIVHGVTAIAAHVHAKCLHCSGFAPGGSVDVNCST